MVEKVMLDELFDIVHSLSSTLDLDTLLKRIGDAAERLTNSEASSIMLLDEDKQHLYFKVATGQKGGIIKKIRVKIGEGIAGWIAQEKEPVIVNDVSKDSRFTGQVDKASGFQTKSLLGVPLLVGDELIGIAEVLNKKDNGQFTEQDKTLLQSLASLAAVSITNARFAENQRNFFVYMIEILTTAIESQVGHLSEHCWRVAQLATILGRALGIEGEDYKALYYGALLHDIGYLATKESVSLAEGIFSIQEKDPEKMHPVIGSEMVQKINLLRAIAPIIRWHHEYYDGSGYPDGLKGEDIPLGARIVNIAEFIEELRISGLPEEKILERIKSESGIKLDARITDILLLEVPSLEEITTY